MSEVRNIYTKLQDMRVSLQGLNVKKTGYNKHLNYNYYELGDFMPPINQLMKENGVCSVVTYGAEVATLTLINAENPEDRITFTSPMAEAKLGNAHPIQNLGAVETYQRRYLYMTAFEIVEADVLDASQGGETGGQSRENGAQNRQNNQKKNNTSGYKKSGQRDSTAQQQRPKQNNKLPSDISDQLNGAIKAAKGATGMNTAEVVAELEAMTGIKMQDVTVENAPEVLRAAEELAGAELPF